MLRAGPPNLLLEYFLDLPDLLFNFAGVMFGFAVSLWARIVRDLACLLFDFAFHFMKLPLISAFVLGFIGFPLVVAYLRGGTSVTRPRQNCHPVEQKADLIPSRSLTDCFFGRDNTARAVCCGFQR
jgi:hypothetical protein